ncbi:FKBP-type peptidyl-prolyl cis-trans isomerase [Mucilaginibacter sp. PAMB04274]|uniref:FKBP-type peptidyl-prolyl cis-trans isomerase n=1 Tax=Mucilaginibacter sp. PAMB04274 TaxID=3138568 RepID=UPI0031F60CB0
MKQSYLALFLLLTTGLFSCRKEGNDVDIKTYDEQQIQAYIKANNLTNMQRDKSGGVDTTGTYYQILGQGKGTPLEYSDRIFYLCTLKSLDGRFALTDTILGSTIQGIYSRAYSPVGYIVPEGLRLAVKNLVKYKGTRARLLIPSRLAYGRSGLGTGSGRLPGNESLDVYINVVNNQDEYDDYVISNYLKTNNLTGYTRINTGEYTGLYYKVTRQGTGTDVIKPTSTVTLQYTGRLVNGPYLSQYIFADGNAEGGNSVVLQEQMPGWVGGLPFAKAGGQLSLFIPSKLGYGVTGSSNGTVSPYSILHYEFTILSVTN